MAVTPKIANARLHNCTMLCSFPPSLSLSSPASHEAIKTSMQKDAILEWKIEGTSTPKEADRKSGTGYTGSPKKGGNGGKYTWAGVDHYCSPAEIGFEKEALDAKDPNFEDPEDAVVVKA